MNTRVTYNDIFWILPKISIVGLHLCKAIMLEVIFKQFVPSLEDNYFTIMQGSTQLKV